MTFKKQVLLILVLVGLLPVFIVTAISLTFSTNSLKESAFERSRHQDRAHETRKRLKEAGLPVIESETHIVPVMVGDPKTCRLITDTLMSRYGIYVQPINYPTVPRGTERLRFTPGPAHTEAMMDELTGALVEIWDRMELELQQAA